MKKHRLRWIIIIAVIIVLVLLVANFPRLQAQAFVALRGAEIEQSVAAGEGIPAGAGGELWEGEHEMAEFILLAWGDAYYGCYLSLDGVPLAFQNAGVPLTQDGHELWVWRAEGDNHGMTCRLTGNWFYFEASF